MTNLTLQCVTGVTVFVDNDTSYEDNSINKDHKDHKDNKNMYNEILKIIEKKIPRNKIKKKDSLWFDDC